MAPHRRTPLAAVALGSLAALVALIVLAGGCGAAPPTLTDVAPALVSVPPAAGPVVVPLALGSDGTRLLARVEVGGTPLTLVVDTGSSGLRVVASKVPAGAGEVVGPAPAYGYASGVRLSGRVARATVGLGDARSLTPTPIELVDATTCAPDTPDCTAAGGAAPGPFGGRYDGILGISAFSDPALGNPLWSFGPIGRAFTMHVDPAGASTLTLGAPPDGFATARLKPAPPGASGARSWQPTVPVCAEAAALLPRGRFCSPTLLDTGTPALAVLRGPAGPDRSAAPGSPVTLSTPDGGWSAGYTNAPGRGAEVRAAGAGEPERSTVGLPAFTRADVRFDLAAGTVGLRAR